MPDNVRHMGGFGAPGHREYATKESEFERPQSWTWRLIAWRAGLVLLLVVEVALIGRGLWDVLVAIIVAVYGVWALGSLRFGQRVLDRWQDDLVGTRWQWLALFVGALVFLAWLNWREGLLYGPFYLFPWVWELSGDPQTGVSWLLHWPCGEWSVLGYRLLSWPARTFTVAGFWAWMRFLAIPALPWVLIQPIRALLFRGSMEVMLPSIPNVMPRNLEFPSIRVPGVGWLGPEPAPAPDRRGVVIHTVDTNGHGHEVRAVRLEDLTTAQWETLFSMAGSPGSCWQKSRPRGEGVPAGFSKRQWQDIQEHLREREMLVTDESGALAPTPEFRQFILSREWEQGAPERAG